MTSASLNHVIQIYGEELRSLARARPGAALETSGPTVLALVRACARSGIRAEEVVTAIEVDRTLWELADAVTREALVSTPDPGPYDVISREASSGTPENKHVGAIGTLEVGLPWEDRWW
jgi:hypothetical protein